MRMLYAGRYDISSVFAFTCGRAKTIRIRYVWTQFFSKTEKRNSVLKNIRIRADGAQVIKSHKQVINTNKFRHIRCHRTGKDNTERDWLTEVDCVDECPVFVTTA